MWQIKTSPYRLVVYLHAEFCVHATTSKTKYYPITSIICRLSKGLRITLCRPADVLFYSSPSTKKNNLIESVAALFLTSGEYSNVKCFFSFLKPIVFETMFCGRIVHWTCTEIKQSVSEISAWFVSFQTVIHHKSEYCDRKAIFKNP